MILRNMIESDIEDNVRWFCEEIEWMNFDAPWEADPSNRAEEEKYWLEVYDKVKDLPIEQRSRLEIEVDGAHIGWVSSYYDLGYIENDEHILAIGIDIPEISKRGNGLGTRALLLYLEHLSRMGHKKVFIQTWSGNLPMLRVIKKLGFEEYARKEKYRIVHGEVYDAITFMKYL